MSKTSPNSDSYQAPPEAAVDAMDEIQSALFEMSKKRIPITRETRIDRYFNDVFGADSLEYLDLSFELEKRLGVEVSEEDWRYLFGGGTTMSPEEWEVKYAALFTFGRLADLIAERASLGPIRPVTILGATSKSAGAFLTIRQIARGLDPSIEPFGPSTPITHRIKPKHMRKFWARMRTLSGNRIPPLRRPPILRLFTRFEVGISAIVGLAFLAAGIGTVLSLFGRMQSTIGEFGGMIGLIGIAALVLAVLLIVIGKVISRSVVALHPRDSVLPFDIRTFRDLAELIANVRGGWCTTCSYDLTGNTSNICPECGTAIFANAVHHTPDMGKNGYH